MKSCCIIGHRKINEEMVEFEQKLKNIFFDLIENKHIYTFNFGNYGEFNDLCHKLLLELKREFPQIKLVLLMI